jgi:hypothetical protein
METINKTKEARKQRRLAELESNHPVCVVCGEDSWECLERHHIAGQAYGNVLCNVCRNCHRKLSDQQKDHPKQITNPPSPIEAIGHFLVGLADLFMLLVARLREYGNALIQSAQAMAGA